MFIELVTFATIIPMMDHDMQNIVPEPVLIQQLKASSEKAFDDIQSLCRQAIRFLYEIYKNKRGCRRDCGGCLCQVVENTQNNPSAAVAESIIVHDGASCYH